MFKRLLNIISVQRSEEREAELYRNLIRHEARLGGQVFGPVPAGHRREFFCLDKHTWVWHEEWVDAHGQRHVQTTRYDVRPSGVMKSQGSVYKPVSDTETVRLFKAVSRYREIVFRDMYALAG